MRWKAYTKKEKPMQIRQLTLKTKKKYRWQN
jgi:hypothetical protein